MYDMFKLNNKKIELPYKYGNEIELDFCRLTSENIKYVSSFKCGNAKIDKFIRKTALKDKETVTYFVRDKKRDVVVSVISIGCTGILHQKPSFKKNYQFMVPAIEIKYFAVSNEYKGLKYSEDATKYTLSHQIFSNYINNINIITNDVCGANKVILYSVPEAISFYKRCRFKDFDNFMAKDESPYLKGCPPMFISLS